MQIHNFLGVSPMLRSAPGRTSFVTFAKAKSFAFTLLCCYLLPEPFDKLWGKRISAAIPHVGACGVATLARLVPIYAVATGGGFGVVHVEPFALSGIAYEVGGACAAAVGRH